MLAARRYRIQSLFIYMLYISRTTALYALIAGCLFACDRESSVTEKPAGDKFEASPRNRAAPPADNKTRTANPAWPLGEKLLVEGVSAAQKLNDAIAQLLRQPSIDMLEQAQQAWRQTATTSERFHLFSRLGSVAPQDFRSLNDMQFNLTAWPIQPGYLDSFGDHPYSGIVFDIGVPLTVEVLREQHGMTDISDVTLGIYAIEFLLFGEQNNRGPLVFQPITELDEKYRADGFSDIEELPRNRRRELLRLQAQILVEDIQRLHTQWIRSEPGQLQHKFEVLTPQQQSELLQKSALALVTEQLVTLANEQPSPNTPAVVTDLWRGQQLADRLSAQLEGLQWLNSVVPLGANVDRELARSIEALKAQTNLPPVSAQGLPNRVNWQDSFTALRELVKSLNPAGPENTSEQSENTLPESAKNEEPPAEM